MARIRTIKPKFWDDVKLSKISRDARLVFIGMWNFSDDLGVIIAEPIWLKSKIFPCDVIQVQQFEKWLDELVKNGFISLLSYKNDRFYYLPNLTRHQVINRPNFDDVNIQKLDLQKVLEDSLNNHGKITDESVQERKGEEEAQAPGDLNEGIKSDLGKNEHPVIPLNPKKQKTVPGNGGEILNPFSDDFKTRWEEWKTYKQKQFSFKFKHLQSEQAAINELFNLSEGNEEKANLIIQQSMAKGWKGLFQLKNQSNGNSQQQSTGGARERQTRASEEMWDEIREIQQLNARRSGTDNSKIFGTSVSASDRK